MAGRTEEIIPTIAKAVGDRAELLADGNSCYSPARAIAVGRIMQDNGLVHFEEPCPYWKLEETRQVTEALEMDVTGGEQDCELATWQRMIDMRAVDIVQPDICYLGGISRTLRVVQMAKEAGLPSPRMRPISAWSRCLPCTCCAPFPMPANISNSPSRGGLLPLAGRPLPRLALRHRRWPATVTDEPGWGVEIDPEWLARSTYQVSEVR